jgi:hypothetical protein
MKKHYYLVLDTETANTLDDPFFYDIGFAVCDRKGNIYEQHSYVNAEVFFGEKDLMQSAYYAEKIPQYYEEIKAGARKVANLYTIRQEILAIFKRYNIRAVCAYNASFDCRALAKTYRYSTKSKYRYFLPYGVEVFDIWHMACQAICNTDKYRKFCEKNGYFSPSGNYLTNAEIVYRFITKNEGFKEAHTGLKDALIESAIMAECYRKHMKLDRKINKGCWRIPQRKAKAE